MSVASSLSTTDQEVSTSATGYLYLVTFLAIVYYFYQRVNRNSWSQYGVKEPKVSLLFTFEEDFRTKFSELLYQYGDTVGMRSGSNLILLTSNFKILKHVLVKDFSNFVERSDNLKSKSPFSKSLFFAKQREWKRHRQIVSPSFTSGKLKHISQWIETSAQSLTSYLEKTAKSGQLVPIKDIAAQYTGEIIAKTAFGLDVNFIGRDDHEFLNYARTMIYPVVGLRRVVFVLLDLIPYGMTIFRALFPNAQYLDPISMEGTDYFKMALKQTIDEKIKQEKQGVLRRHVDFLDLLLKANNAAKEGKVEDVDDDDEGDIKINKSSWEGVASAMSDDEILGHSMLIIFAGMETTATTLQLALTQLARNPDIQDRVYQEIQSVVKSVTPTTEELSKLHLVEQVINETLRMHPPAPIVTRKALETRTYEGVTIPKGVQVIIPYYHIMTDPNVYPDPKTFNPDRFSPEEKDKRDLMAFIPFGQGPRQCLGMRLALLELKVALVHILRKMKSVVNDQTVPRKGEELKFAAQGLLNTVEPIKLSFVLRE